MGSSLGEVFSIHQSLSYTLVDFKAKVSQAAEVVALVFFAELGDG